MAKLKQLEMGKIVSLNPNITVKNGFLGLTQSVIYNPTQSKVSITRQDYTPEVGHWIEQVLNARSEDLEQKVTRIGKVESVPVGNAHLERCVSEDHHFVAAQLFRYVDFDYIPVTEVKFFEGRDARLVASLF